jgi:hypothetical protein
LEDKALFMPLPFDQVMSQRSDIDLLHIVTKARDDYQPEAIEAALRELARRDISTDLFDEVMEEMEQQRQEEARKTLAPLELHWKILTFLFPVVVHFALSGNFKLDGYTRKLRELSRATLLGLVCYVLAVAAFELFA